MACGTRLEKLDRDLVSVILGVTSAQPAARTMVIRLPEAGVAKVSARAGADAKSRSPKRASASLRLRANGTRALLPACS